MNGELALLALFGIGVCSLLLILYWTGNQ